MITGVDPRTLQKIMHWCAWQERSRQETDLKLQKLKVEEPTIREAILDYLTDENYLSIERFVSTFVRSKFNLKGWGRVKIRHHLRFHQIPPAEIEKALEKEIDPEVYQNEVAEQARKYRQLNPERNRATTIRYFLQRGFEFPVILPALAGLFDPASEPETEADFSDTGPEEEPIFND